MDEAPLLSVQIVQDKAFTAISLEGLATHEMLPFPSVRTSSRLRHVQPVGVPPGSQASWTRWKEVAY